MNRRRLMLLGTVAAAVGGAAAYRGLSARSGDSTAVHSDNEALEGLGWGALAAPSRLTVATKDGANLAVWDVGGTEAESTTVKSNGKSKKSTTPTVVLAHCWGCSHAIWVPVARRLVESGYRVVLYDQRGHGESTRGTSPLNIETLADDLSAVLEARGVRDAVLTGHSMGGMTVMGLAAHRPKVLEDRARSLVLVATAAADMGVGLSQATNIAATLIASPLVTRALRAPNGHRFVRGVFGNNPVPAHMDLTRTLFADCSPAVRAGFLVSMTEMNLLEGIATIGVPTTVVIGSRDRLTAPVRSRQMIDTIPGSRLVTLDGRGHMLPLEDPDAVADEIIRAAKG
jgi:pimeloyl-ACP methyl ester carboxylesterase